MEFKKLPEACCLPCSATWRTTLRKDSSSACLLTLSSSSAAWSSKSSYAASASTGFFTLDGLKSGARSFITILNAYPTFLMRLCRGLKVERGATLLGVAAAAGGCGVVAAAATLATALVVALVETIAAVVVSAKVVVSTSAGSVVLSLSLSLGTGFGAAQCKSRARTQQQMLNLFISALKLLPKRTRVQTLDVLVREHVLHSKAFT